MKRAILLDYEKRNKDTNLTETGASGVHPVKGRGGDHKDVSHMNGHEKKRNDLRDSGTQW